MKSVHLTLLSIRLGVSFQLEHLKRVTNHGLNLSTQWSFLENGSFFQLKKKKQIKLKPWNGINNKKSYEVIRPSSWSTSRRVKSGITLFLSLQVGQESSLLVERAEKHEQTFVDIMWQNIASVEWQTVQELNLSTQMFWTLACASTSRSSP